MGRVLVDRREIEEIKNGFCLGRGKEGACYYLEDDNIVAKIYYYFSANRQVYFDSESSRLITFPIDILIDSCSNSITGYTFNPTRGEHFKNGFRNFLSLEDLKKAYQEICLEIKKYPNIYMDDNCLDNILFDYVNKRMSLIDTSRWYPKEDSLERNLEIFNWQIMTALCQGNLDWVNNPLNRDNKLFELYRMHKLEIQSLPMEFLEELERKVSEIKGEKVKTIGDLTRK